MQDMKFLRSKVWPGGLSADDDINDNDNDDANDNTRWAIHNYIGSIAFMPNESKKGHN